MRRALIGYTGFVGSSLDRQLTFTHRYNSSNIEDIEGESFDEIVCAGVQAVKWWANGNPKEDWNRIDRLLSLLDKVHTRQFTLISTVDVYKSPVNVTENSTIETQGLHHYGLHRFRVEERIRARHPDALILRLPGLFGQGLKKNLIFDVLTGKDLSGFDADSRFQFYDLECISKDIQIARANNLKLINVAVEPVSVSSVVTRISDQSFGNTTDTPPINYAMKTVHSRYWGRESEYLSDAVDCLQRIESFTRMWRAQ